MPRGKIISCLNASKMIAKGCLYHVVRVKNLEYETPFIESFHVVRDFSMVFPNNFPGVPPEWEIYFCH